MQKYRFAIKIDEETKKILDNEKEKTDVPIVKLIKRAVEMAYVKNEITK